MKYRKALTVMFCCCVALCCRIAAADCGKMIIYPYQWSYMPPGGQQTDLGHDSPDLTNWTNQNQNQGGNSTVNVNVGQLQENYNQLLQRVQELTELISKLQQKLDTPRTDIGSSDNVDRDAVKDPGNSESDRNVGDAKDNGYEVAETDADGNVTVAGYFNEPEQQAVIAWNGKRAKNGGRETLVLSTNEEIKGLGGQKAYLLSVLPLPGEPISVEPANPKAFMIAKGLFFSKAPKPATSETEFGVIKTAKIGAHNIFVWELDSADTFQKDVQAWVAKEFDGQAAAYIDNETMNVLQYYINSGFKYFAFDLTEVGSISTKASIAYTFKSDSVYYPLVISRIGGSSGFSTVDLVIITPGKLSPAKMSAIQKLRTEDKPALEDDAATLVRSGSVTFSRNEVRSIDKSLDVFDEGTRELTVRNVKFKKRLNSYKKDFYMIDAPRP